MSSQPFDPFKSMDIKTTPFHHEEEVWFWFMGANQARLDGAARMSGQGGPVRPCEPVDILRILDRLYRSRHLSLEHFRILRHYGERLSAPDKWKPREARAAIFWREAMSALREVFIQKGIITIAEEEKNNNNLIWMHEAAERLNNRWGMRSMR